jgi:beta-phosphoglucomutase family hydrolase
MAQENGRGVIFDLDGVLVDTGEFHRQSWWDLARQEDWTGYSDDFFYRTFGMQNGQIIPQILGRPVSGEEINRMSDWKEERYRELIAGKLTLLEGVETLIDDLRVHGFRLAIGTSTPPENLHFMLKEMPIHDRLDAFVTSADVRRSKPAPDTFLMAAEKLGLPPRRCVVVEDAVQGVAAGKAAGMAVVAVTNTRTRADLAQADQIVDSLTELTAADFERLIAAGR